MPIFVVKSIVLQISGLGYGSFNCATILDCPGFEESESTKARAV